MTPNKLKSFVSYTADLGQIWLTIQLSSGYMPKLDYLVFQVGGLFSHKKGHFLINSKEKLYFSLNDNDHQQI